MSHRQSLLGRGYEDSHLDSPRVRFRRALLLGLMTLVVPGSAQIAVGRKWVGWVAVAIWLSAIGGLVYLYLRFGSNTAGAIDLLTDPSTLLYVRIGLIALAIGWLLLFIDAWRLGSPRGLPWYRSLVLAVINIAVITGVAGSAAYASQVIGVSRELVTEVFTATETSAPLEGRYNILMIGSDSGDDRTGLRPDSMIVASIDTSTGRTVLVSIPRNLQNAPFAEDSPMQQEYPYGFNCGSECLINAVHTTAENRTDLYPDAESPGLEATFDVVEGVTGLKLNYYMMVNMQGFKSLIDAVGGVEIDVKTRLPKFGSADTWKNVYIEPGVQTLNGQDALWYARSRLGSDDYTRMGRQKCLMSAMLEQMTPATVITNAVEMAKSGKELLSGNIPRQELGQFGELALKARDEKIKTVSLVPPEVNPGNPDYEAIKKMVADAIEASEQGSDVPDDGETAAPTPTPSVNPTDQDASEEDLEKLTQRSANNSDDLSASC